jgi:hypothetical protein
MGPVYTNSDVPAGAPPMIDSFTANRKSILAGQTVTLSWTTSDASYNLIAPTIGPVRGTSLTIRPSRAGRSSCTRPISMGNRSLE